MQLPITIGLHRSCLLGRLIAVVAILGAATALAFPVMLLLRLALFVLVVLLAMLAWRQNRPSVWALRLERDGSFALAGRGDSDFIAASCLPGATVHPWLTVFRLQTEQGRRYSVVLVPDSLAAADFRRLRVFLRWRAELSSGADA